MRIKLQSKELPTYLPLVVRGSWQGDDIPVDLADGTTGILEAIGQNPDRAYRFRWSLTGAIYELGLHYSTITITINGVRQGPAADWNSVLKLVPPAESPFQAMTPYHPDNSAPVMKPYRP